MGISEFVRLSLSDIEKNHNELLAGNLVFRRDKVLRKKPVWSNASFVRVVRDDKNEHVWYWYFHCPNVSVFSSPVFIVCVREYLGFDGYTVSILSIKVNNQEIYKLDKSKSLLYYLNKYGNSQVFENVGG